MEKLEGVIMLIAFLIIFILSSHLIHFVKTNVHLLEDRNPSVVSSFYNFYHAILLIMSIYYLGWLFGTVLFICHFLALTHASVSWVLDIPLLILRAKNRNREPIRLIDCIFNLSFPMVIITIFFIIISFYENKFMSMYYYLKDNLYILMPVGIVVTLLSISRIIVAKIAAKK